MARPLAEATLVSCETPEPGREGEAMDDEKQTLGIGKGTPGPGRPKGVPNKLTRSAKEAIALAAEKLGGFERLVAWVQEDPGNEKVFWGTIYPKLIPVTLANEEGSTGLSLSVTLVKPDAGQMLV